MIISQISSREESAAINITSKYTPTSIPIKLHAADIVLICIFIVLLCFTILYLALYKSREAPRTSRKPQMFHSFQDLSAARGGNMSEASLPNPTHPSATSDNHSADPRDVERSSRKVPALTKPISGPPTDERRSRFRRWVPFITASSEPRSGCPRLDTTLREEADPTGRNIAITGLPPVHLKSNATKHTFERVREPIWGM